MFRGFDDCLCAPQTDAAFAGMLFDMVDVNRTGVMGALDFRRLLYHFGQVCVQREGERMRERGCVLIE